MADMRSARPSWDAGILVVCRKCDGYAKSLRAGLKEALAEAGLRKHVRVVTSSCLDVCPKRATAVVLATARGTDVVVVAEGADDAVSLAPLVRRFAKDRGDEILGRRNP